MSIGVPTIVWNSSTSAGERPLLTASFIKSSHAGSCFKNLRLKKVPHGKRDKANKDKSNKVHCLSVVYEVLTTLICFRKND